MHKLARGTLLVAGCVLLTGCPRVSRVDGSVTGKMGSFLGTPRQLQVNDEPSPFSRVTVAAGASVTLREGSCEVTFTTSFIVPAKLGTCDRKDDDKQDQDQQEDQQQSQDQQEDRQQSQDQQSGQQQGQQEQPTGQQQPQPGQGSGQPSSGGGGGSGSPTSGGGGAEGAGGGMSTLQTTLIVAGSLVAGKELYDQLKDDPVSR